MVLRHLGIRLGHENMHCLAQGEECAIQSNHELISGKNAQNAAISGHYCSIGHMWALYRRLLIAIFLACLSFLSAWCGRQRGTAAADHWRWWLSGGWECFGTGRWRRWTRLTLLGAGTTRLLWLAKWGKRRWRHKTVATGQHADQPFTRSTKIRRRRCCWLLIIWGTQQASQTQGTTTGIAKTNFHNYFFIKVLLLKTVKCVIRIRKTEN